MIPIKELINKITWDKREKPEDYALWFLDLDRLVEMPYVAIKRLDGNFMVVEKEGEEVEIPLHRVREVRKKGVVVWKRELKTREGEKK
jgi:uncharacterized protein (UPF0248 family)